MEHKDNPKEIEIIDKILENIRIIDSRARITGNAVQIFQNMKWEGIWKFVWI